MAPLVVAVVEMVELAGMLVETKLSVEEETMVLPIEMIVVAAAVASGQVGAVDMMAVNVKVGVELALATTSQRAIAPVEIAASFRIQKMTAEEGVAMVVVEAGVTAVAAIVAVIVVVIVAVIVGVIVTGAVGGTDLPGRNVSRPLFQTSPPSALSWATYLGIAQRTPLPIFSRPLDSRLWT